MSRIGEKIKNTRIDLGMSQKQLAKKLGVAESFINEVELGRKIINEALINKISKVLGKNINDISMSIEEETAQEEKTVERREITLNNNKTNKAKSKELGEVNELWNEAFSSVLKTVPIYKYDLKQSVGTKLLPIISNKVEGFSQDKVFYLQIEDDDMIGFRIDKGDIGFAHLTNQIDNNGIYLIEYNSERAIRQIKKLDSNKLLLISNRGSVRTETVNIKDIHIIGKIERIEIKL